MNTFLIILSLIVFIILFINRKVKSKENTFNEKEHNKTSLSRETLKNINQNRYNIKTQRFKIPIPKDYRIYFQRIEVAGTFFKKDNLLNAFSNDKIEISFESEPNNEHDENAIKVIITNSSNKKFHIGYVPKEIAEIITKSKMLDCILPRLKYINFNHVDNIIIEFDILGLKSEYSKYIK